MGPFSLFGMRGSELGLLASCVNRGELGDDMDIDMAEMLGTGDIDGEREPCELSGPNLATWGILIRGNASLQVELDVVVVVEVGKLDGTFELAHGSSVSVGLPFSETAAAAAAAAAANN